VQPKRRRESRRDRDHRLSLWCGLEDGSAVARMKRSEIRDRRETVVRMKRVKSGNPVPLRSCSQTSLRYVRVAKMRRDSGPISASV
jgi:hypothetical protein